MASDPALIHNLRLRADTIPDRDTGGLLKRAADRIEHLTGLVQSVSNFIDQNGNAASRIIHDNRKLWRLLNNTGAQP